MSGLITAINQSTLTRFLANMFLFAVLMTALIIAAYQLLTTGIVNPILATVLGTGVGTAIHAAGINQGAVLSPITPETTVIGIPTTPKANN